MAGGCRAGAGAAGAAWAAGAGAAGAGASRALPDRATGVCEINALFDSGAYSIGLRKHTKPGAG